MKPFAETFPSLSLGGEAAEQMAHTQVTRVTVNPARDHMKIYLTGTYPIHKEIIFETERAIERQLCFDFRVQVTIIEHYALSGQFTARRLMDVYADSIMAELRARNIFLYDMLRRAQVSFTEEAAGWDEEKARLAQQEEEARLLVLVYYDGLSLAQIARMQQTPASTGKSM